MTPSRASKLIIDVCTGPDPDAFSIITVTGYDDPDPLALPHLHRELDASGYAELCLATLEPSTTPSTPTPRHLALPSWSRP